MVKFETMQQEILKAMCCSDIDVISFIDRLRGLSAVTDGHLSMFDDDLFEGVNTIEALWEKFKVFWLSIFDCHVLKIFLKKSKCGEAIRIYKAFSSKLDQSGAVNDADLVAVYKVFYQKVSKMSESFFIIKVKTDICIKLKIKRIYKILSKIFKIQKYALHLTDIKEGSVDLIFETSKRVISYFLNYKITGRILLELAEESIATLQINNFEIKVPDKINKVLSYNMIIDTYL